MKMISKWVIAVVLLLAVALVGYRVFGHLYPRDYYSRWKLRQISERLFGKRPAGRVKASSRPLIQR